MTQSEYIARVHSLLHLPRAARKQLEQELRRDIDTMLAQGETWEKIEARMGTPEQTAAALSAQWEAPGTPQERSRVLQILSLLFLALAVFTLGRAPFAGTPWAQAVLDAAFYAAVGLCGFFYDRDLRTGLDREKSRRRLGGRIAICSLLVGIGWTAAALLGDTVTRSVALISGPDGPTAYFSTAALRPAWLHVALFAALAIAGLAVCLIRSKREKETIE